MNLNMNFLQTCGTEKKSQKFVELKENTNNFSSVIDLLKMLQKAPCRHISIAILVRSAWPELWSVVVDEYYLLALR